MEGGAVPRRTRPYRAAIAFLGMLVFTVAMTQAREYIRSVIKFDDVYFLTFFTMLGCFVVSLLISTKKNPIKITLKAPKFYYILVSIFHLTSMILTNYVINKIGHSGESLFKSTSMILVMIGNLVILKKRPSTVVAITACMTVLALVTLSLRCIQKNAFMNISCLYAIFVSLVLDVLSANIIEKMFVTYGCTHQEISTVVFGLSIFISAFITLKSGSYTKSFSILMENKRTALVLQGYALLCSMSMHFYFLAIESLGSLYASSIHSIIKTGYNVSKKVILSKIDVLAAVLLTASFTVLVRISIEKAPIEDDYQFHGQDPVIEEA